MRKILATIRKYLHGDRAAILQGVALARQHPALHPVLGAGLTMHPGGAVTWTKDSEVARRVLMTHRPFAALQLWLMTQGASIGEVTLSGEQAPEQVAALTDLRLLRLCDDALTSLEPLAGMDRLESLSLYGCGDITDLSPLAALPALRTLTIIGCTGVRRLEPLLGCAGLEELLVAGAAVEDLEALQQAWPQRHGGRALIVHRAPVLPPVRIINAGKICSTLALSSEQLRIIDRSFAGAATAVKQLAHERSWPLKIRTLDQRMKQRPLLESLTVQKLCDLPAHVVLSVPAEANRHLLGDGDDVIDFYIILQTAGVSGAAA